MDLKKESLLVKIWNVLWPLFIYLVTQNVVAAIGSLIIPNEDYLIVFLIIAALICIPISSYLIGVIVNALFDVTTECEGITPFTTAPAPITVPSPI